MGKREASETLLQGVIRAFGLRPTHIVRVARRLAAELHSPSVSRYHLTRLCRGDAKNATQETIRIIVAAIRELTGRPFGAADLFDVQPALVGAPAARFESAEARVRSNLSIPLFSAGNRLSRIWRIAVPNETGMSPDKAFETLYVEFGGLLRSTAVERYGVPPEEAETLVHDTFIAYLQRHTYINDVKGWLFITLRNRCVDYRRARQHETPLLPEHDGTVDEASEARVELWMRKLTLSAVLARLGEKCRESLQGYFCREERRNVLADRLATTPAYIDRLISTCRRRAVELFRTLTVRTK